ncbi:hypothetical protein [Kitasatospora cineracea]|uniref:hypothetical protein n=1 Tax=Kitasatospora cineracea TaxID=88074 RepID=UPI0013C2AEAB|nr:hypothetical protein [Kitasatospora cineracea]
MLSASVCTGSGASGVGVGVGVGLGVGSGVGVGVGVGLGVGVGVGSGVGLSLATGLGEAVVAAGAGAASFLSGPKIAASQKTDITAHHTTSSTFTPRCSRLDRHAITPATGGRKSSSAIRATRFPVVRCSGLVDGAWYGFTGVFLG